jgi:hypothetical protein
MTGTIGGVGQGDAEMVKCGTFIGDIWPQWLHIRFRKTLRATDKGQSRNKREKRLVQACRVILAGMHLMIIPFPLVTFFFRKPVRLPERVRGSNQPCSKPSPSINAPRHYA